MSHDEWTGDWLTISGQEIPVQLGWMSQHDLSFYLDNPRLYSVVQAMGREPSQEEIQQCLQAMDHVKLLVHSIKANGGLSDPLVVREGDFVVLEGNSRLAACRALAAGDPLTWGHVKVKLLPSNLDENLIFALLGEYHIIGKKDWAPFEQAGYLFRRHIQHGISTASMAAEMGLTKARIDHLIAVYRFMQDHKETDVTRWSYYDEYLKSRHIAAARAALPALDKVVTTKVKKREIARAADIRDKLAKVAKAGGKELTKFVEGKDTLDEAYETAVESGVNNVQFQRLNKFRKRILEDDFWTELESMLPKQRAKCKFELKRILQIIQQHEHEL